MARFRYVLYLFILIPLTTWAQTIEIPYQDKAGWMIVNLHVNGKPMNFIFDTGWDGLAVRKSLLDTYKDSSQIQAVDANNVIQEIQTLKVDSLKVGNYTFYNLYFTDLESFPMLQDPIFDCYQIDGILGNLVYRDRVLEIDPVNKKIILKDPEPHLAKELQQDGFVMIKNANKSNQNRIYIPMEIAGVKKDFLLDTGDTGYISLGVDRQVVDYLATIDFNKYVGIGSVGAFGVDDRLSQTFISDNQTIKMQNIVLENQEVNFTPKAHVSQLGVEFIKQFHLVYIPRKAQLFLKPIKDFKQPVSTLEKMNFGIAFLQGYYTIAAISENQKDLQLGDVVLEIDGIAMKDLCDYRIYFRNLQTPPVLTIYRNGQEMQITPK
ncbi:aspartyl protease family protein [Myroides sp. LJL119]